jgi:hypothetical protein
MVLRLIRDLPGDQTLLSPLPCVISQNVTPALGRQDHTISPSAICCSSDNTPRPSHPAPNVRDDREAPLLQARDARIIVLICPTRQHPSGCGRLARRAVCAWRACEALTTVMASASEDPLGWAKRPCPASLARKRAPPFTRQRGEMMGTELCAFACPAQHSRTPARPRHSGRRDSIESEFRYSGFNRAAIGDTESADLSALPRHIDERHDTFHHCNK